MRSGLRAAAVNLSLGAIGFTTALGAFELLLRTGVLDQSNSEKPIWIPPRFQAIDDSINALNRVLARDNPWGFTDRAWPVEKPSGKYRIAVLGDSYVWGDGVPPFHAWGHRLARLVVDAGFDKVELLSWGDNGWTTKDEVRFFKNHGHSFDIDMLVVSWFSNDPEIDGLRAREPLWHKSAVGRGLGVTLPHVHAFLTSTVNLIIARFDRRFGYSNWEERLYENDNLTRYVDVLEDLRATADRHRVRLLVVMVPGSKSDLFRERHQKIIPLFQAIGIDYLDLQPMVSSELAAFSDRELWANPGNGHAGNELAAFYARQTLRYLRSEGVLENNGTMR